MTLAIQTITRAIADLSIKGVIIRDTHEIPEAVDVRMCPILYPEPVNFISGFSVERDSFGAAAQAKKTVTYTLTYTYLHAPIGTGRGLFDVYDGLVKNVFAILDALILADALTGTIELIPLTPVNVGPVGDPAGNRFHGCQFELSVTEFVN